MARAHTAFTLVLWLTASAAAAQDSRPKPVVTLVPDSPSRWDAAAHVTWLGERRLDRLGSPFSSDRWIEAASGGGALGYYWTSHLKLEADLSTSTEGESYSYEPAPLPLPPGFPSFVERDHELRVTTLALGVSYQFLENAWFHPFIGAGAELLRERERIRTAVPIVFPRDPRGPAVPPIQAEERVRYGARPFAEGGFKAYVSERAFIRTDVRTSWSGDGVVALAWRAGVGFDF